MKILHVLQSNRFSGAENVVCQIINMFRNDADVEMAYTSPDGQIREALEERGIIFFPMDKLCKKELKRVINEYAPNILHAHDISASVIASCVGKGKIVSTIHGNHTNMHNINLKTLLFLLASHKIEHIFWVSQSAIDQYKLKSFLKQKSSVLCNVIDCNELIEKMQKDENNYHYDIVYIGRLSHEKNPLRLMLVLSKVINQLPNVSVAVVGTGELEDDAKTAAEQLKLLDNVSFLGFMSNPLKLLNDAKVMFMTSIYEGTPMCALEAMAFGVPIVSTPTDGMCDLVVDGETGYLSNDNDVLAERMCQIIQDSLLYNKLSKNTENRFSEISDVKKYKQAIVKTYID